MQNSVQPYFFNSNLAILAFDDPETSQVYDPAELIAEVLAEAEVAESLELTQFASNAVCWNEEGLDSLSEI